MLFEIIVFPIAILAIILLCLLIRLVFIVIRYQILNIPLKKLGLKRMPGLVPVAEFFDSNVGCEHLLELKQWASEKNPEEMERIVHDGPYLDGTPIIGFNDPEDLKILLTETDHFPKLPIAYDMLAELLGNGLAISDGELWKSQRKLITPSFHFNALKIMSSVMIEEAINMVEEIKSLAPGSSVHAADFFGKITFRVIAACAFGKHIDPEIADLWKILNVEFNLYAFGFLLFGKKVTDLFPLPSFIRFRSAREKLDRKVKEAIDKRRADINEEIKKGASEESLAVDFLSNLLIAKDENGNGMDESLIIDESKTFTFAGHDTTSALLGWAMDFLILYPEWQEKLQEEVDRVLNGRTISYEDINNLPLVKNTLMETLRLRPPVPMLERIAAEDCELGGVSFKKGTYLWLYIYNANTNPKYWKDSLQFNPTRWEEPPGHAFSFLSFSAGGRNCIGRKFSLTEAIILLATLMQNFTIVKTKDTKPPKWIFEGTMVITTKGPFPSFSL